MSSKEARHDARGPQHSGHRPHNFAAKDLVALVLGVTIGVGVALAFGNELVDGAIYLWVDLLQPGFQKLCESGIAWCS